MSLACLCIMTALFPDTMCTLILITIVFSELEYSEGLWAGTTWHNYHTAGRVTGSSHSGEASPPFPPSHTGRREHGVPALRRTLLVIVLFKWTRGALRRTLLEPAPAPTCVCQRYNSCHSPAPHVPQINARLSRSQHHELVYNDLVSGMHLAMRNVIVTQPLV